jgi:hypothetical protein
VRLQVSEEDFHEYFSFGSLMPGKPLMPDGDFQISFSYKGVGGCVLIEVSIRFLRRKVRAFIQVAGEFPFASW